MSLRIILFRLHFRFCVFFSLLFSFSLFWNFEVVSFIHPSIHPFARSLFHFSFLHFFCCHHFFYVNYINVVKVMVVILSQQKSLRYRGCGDIYEKKSNSLPASLYGMRNVASHLSFQAIHTLFGRLRTRCFVL